MRDFTEELGALHRRLADAAGYLDLEGKRKRLADLEAEVGRPGLWDSPADARRVTTEFGRVKEDVDVLARLGRRLEDAETLYELAVAEGDESQEPEIAESVASLRKEVDALELRSLFSGEYDENDAVCDVHAGEGGTDAQDWAQMMVRMYQRWAERRGLEVEIDVVTEAQDAVILSVSFIVKGSYADVLLTAERCVQRRYR